MFGSFQTTALLCKIRYPLFPLLLFLGTSNLCVVITKQFLLIYLTKFFFYSPLNLVSCNEDIAHVSTLHTQLQSLILSSIVANIFCILPKTLNPFLKSSP